MNTNDDYWRERVAHLEAANTQLRELIGAVQQAELYLDTGDDADEEDALRGRYADAIERLLRHDLSQSGIAT